MRQNTIQLCGAWPSFLPMFPSAQRCTFKMTFSFTVKWGQKSSSTLVFETCKIEDENEDWKWRRHII